MADVAGVWMMYIRFGGPNMLDLMFSHVFSGILADVPHSEVSEKVRWYLAPTGS